MKKYKLIANFPYFVNRFSYFVNLFYHIEVYLQTGKKQ
jgi:hypothetical protein